VDTLNKLSRRARRPTWQDSGVHQIDVALASCRVLPKLDTDEAPLLNALRAAGLRAERLAWDDPAADFSGARVTLLRSTWNYTEAPERFAAWLEETATASSLWNPLPVVRWNLHKRYLVELARAGVPVVPTHLVSRGSSECLTDIAAAHGWHDVVIKPAISAGSRRTLRADATANGRGEAHLRALVARADALVQPYAPAVEGHGERALTFIDGKLTHAVRKSPRFAGDAESVSGPLPINDEEAALAEAALAAAPGPVLYARVDVVPDGAGRPMLMELELMEPSLFFTGAPQAVERFARALRERV
jgi:hypothetical protein